MSDATGPIPVVMGVIDDGIAFAHERFRSLVNGRWKSRVESWWLQDGAHQGSTSSVPYGRELRKAEIDNLLDACNRAGHVDEDLLYRKAGLIDFRQAGHKSAAWRAAHGTHVMDLACGLVPYEPQAERPIVCVQLPTRVTAQTSGAALYPYALDAIAYILSCAEEISKERGYSHLPVVINLSYGRLAGPHDGTLDLESAIDDIVDNCAEHGISLRVVLPSGNSYLYRCHSQVSFERRSQTASLLWRVMPDDRTPSFLEIWLPPRKSGLSASRIELKITSPTGQSRSIGETPGAVRWASGNQTYAKAHYVISPITQRGMFLIALAPTAQLDPTATLSPAGTWTIELRNRGLSRADTIHAWIQRDDTLYGFPSQGRQSCFDHACYARYDHAGRDNEMDDAACVVKRDSTINGIATGQHPIVIGGYLGKEMVAAPYSAAGSSIPSASSPRKPDALAISDNSRVHRGVLAAGTRSGSVVAIGGTSVAAPQVARWCASQLASGNAGNRASVQALAAQDEAGLPAGTPAVPSPQRGGSGRLRLPSPGPLKGRMDP
ncbi:hypothetical protein GGR34_002042 [Microvirga flocculans]|uniref:Peptidase S8/S53 domain-containing protein n=1 Tax=Microvirga flocculans TaxID=217168 RepID=A0A7W6IFJ5_9HYPH|nr:S8 family serine peptidase [Microvirga flocculans]MBB4040389.1 hypothetical protein [Microvirga flocculans]